MKTRIDVPSEMQDRMRRFGGSPEEAAEAFRSTKRRATRNGESTKRLLKAFRETDKRETD